MNTKRKILFMDLDDTLLTHDKRLTQENADAITRALEAGHLIVINTGRPLPGALPFLRRLHLDREGCFAITYNGGLIYDPYHEKTLYKKSVPLPYVRHVFQSAEAHGLYCQTYLDKALLCKSPAEETDYYCSRNAIAWKADPGLPDTLEEEPVKVLVINLHDRSLLEDYRRDIEPWAAGKLSIFFSSDYYLEHVAHGISKGGAIRFLCDYLKIPMEQTIAIGDAENDIPMLEAAHIGIAVQNASGPVKAAADYVTASDCDHGAVSEAITKFMFF